VAKLGVFFSEWILPPKAREIAQHVKKEIRRRRDKNPFLEGGFQLHEELGRKPASLYELRTARPGDVLWVPLENVRSVLATAFSWEQNHYVRYLRDGAVSLQRFYDTHQPRNPLEMLFLKTSDIDNPVSSSTQKLWDPPWQRLRSRSSAQVLDSQWFGPVGQRRFDEEVSRTNEVLHSITESGLWFKSCDNISFWLLVLDSDVGESQYRVIVADGNHRVAVLAHLGWRMIPMEPLMDFVGEVRLSDIDDWPGVLDGTYSAHSAEKYFRAFFREPHEVLLPAW
jgi:hypothetical protein